MARERFVWFSAVVLLFLLIGGLFSRATLGEPSGKEGLKSPRFEFGLIGDLPYNAEQEIQFARLMDRDECSRPTATLRRL